MAFGEVGVDCFKYCQTDFEVVGGGMEESCSIYDGITGIQALASLVIVEGCQRGCWDSIPHTRWQCDVSTTIIVYPNMVGSQVS